MESIKCSDPKFGPPAPEKPARRIFCFANASAVAYHTLPGASLISMTLKKLLWTTALLSLSGFTSAATFPESGPIVPGNMARLRGKLAAAPQNAPLIVKRAIWAANQLHAKPYRYGGGHRSFSDNAYDCSGTVSYALGGAGVITAPMSSSEFRNFGKSGCGKWITIYARRGHTFAVIAGLRLDTTPYITGQEKWAPGWQASFRQPDGFEARHPIGL
jgi:hypothetical protein